MELLGSKKLSEVFRAYAPGVPHDSVQVNVRM